MPATPQHRTIRSYVLRQGRLTSGQARALEQHWRDYGIDFSGAALDLHACFGRRAPRVLDIGCGMGDTTLELARRHPENDYLAVEVHRPGVGHLIRRAAAEGVYNLRVICHDVLDVLQTGLPERSLDQVYIFFPDPWPKKKHHKRRLVSTAFLARLLPKLKSHARLYLATDWEDLAAHMLQVCDDCDGLINLAGRGHYTPRPLWRPQTRFESRGRRLQHGVYDLAYCTVS